jgi:hypothetical protein
MVVEEAPDDQRSYPLTKSAPSVLGAAGFLSHGAPLSAVSASGARFVRGLRAGELERRQCPDELGMGGANVQIGALEELLLVLRPEDVATAAADLSHDIDSHLTNRTALTGLPFLFLLLSPRSSLRPRTRAEDSQSPA